MTLVAESLSQTKSIPVRWLWEPYIPRGKLALVDGDPGVGKSLLTINLAARLSRGGYLPDGKSSERPHVTLLLSTEDEAGDTIRPRAEAAGADLDCVVTVNDLDGRADSLAGRSGGPGAVDSRAPGRSRRPRPGDGVPPARNRVEFRPMHPPGVFPTGAAGRANRLRDAIRCAIFAKRAARRRCIADWEASGSSARFAPG